jgi:peptide/nickel transport system substrate-binding protein
MNDMLVEDVAAIPLVNKAEINGVSNTLEGIEFNPWDTATWNIKNWRRK